MAIALPPDGKVVACDVTDKHMKDVNAQQYFKEVTTCKDQSAVLVYIHTSHGC